MHRLYNAIDYCYKNDLLKNVSKGPHMYGFDLTPHIHANVIYDIDFDCLEVLVNGHRNKSFVYSRLEGKAYRAMLKFFKQVKKLHKNSSTIIDKHEGENAEKIFKECIDGIFCDNMFMNFLK